jgi:hypothetical protein
MKKKYLFLLGFMMILPFHCYAAEQLTIAEKLQDLLKTKEDIRQAIISNGEDLPDTVPFSQYGARIATLSSNWVCPSGETPHPLGFFDGTNCSFVNYSYVKDASGSMTFSMITNGDNACNKVKGEGICTSDTGTSGARGLPIAPNGSGGKCWCRMTAPRTGAWVLVFSIGLAGDCMSGLTCAGTCADDIKNKAGFRAVILGP